MPTELSFRFSLPNTADGKCVSAEEVENTLLRRLKEHESNPDEALWELARFYSVTGRQRIALSYMERLIPRTDDPERKAACFLALGQLMEQIKDYESAMSCYGRAFSLEPVNGQTWYFINNNLGYCLNHFGRYKEAEPYCRTAIQIDPERHNAYKNLGISLEGQGQFAAAARCFIEAVQANAADPRALSHLEELLARHPEISCGMPDVHDELLKCRQAVHTAAHIRVGLIGGDIKER